MSKKLREAIVQNVKMYPFNIKQALELSARQTKCTFNQASYLYYGACPKSRANSIRVQKPIFATVTDFGMSINIASSSATKITKKILECKNEQIDLSAFDTEQKVAFFDMVFK